jgi:hypothetical protein
MSEEVTEFFQFTKPSQPLTEMSTRNTPGGGGGGGLSAAGALGGQPDRGLRAGCLQGVGFPTSHNPIGLHGL